MQNFMKTIITAVQMWTKGKIKESTADWNQNDPSTDNYVKNRTHWEESSLTILVDNLSGEDYSNGNNVPKCKFIPGEKYNVIWNDTLYEDLVCYRSGSYNVIASEDNGCPFYIDDDGGNGLYITDDNSNWSVSITHYGTIIHKLDAKYLDIPDNIATLDDVQNSVDLANAAQNTANSAIANAETAQTTADSKMNAIDPVGSGSFSMNRKESRHIGSHSGTIGYNNSAEGDYSYAQGHETVAGTRSQHVSGEYNIKNAAYTAEEKTDGGDFLFEKGKNFYCSTEYAIDPNTGIFTLISPVQVTASQLHSNFSSYIGYYFITNYEAPSSWTFKILPEVTSGTGLYFIRSSSKESNYSDLYYQVDYRGKVRPINNYNARGTYVNIVGNGTADDARSNAHTLDWEGNAWYQGDIYLGGASQYDEVAKKVATEEYVDDRISTLESGGLIETDPELDTEGMAADAKATGDAISLLSSKIPVVLTQAEYDAMREAGTLNETTLYVISEEW